MGGFAPDFEDKQNHLRALRSRQDLFQVYYLPQLTAVIMRCSYDNHWNNIYSSSSKI